MIKLSDKKTNGPGVVCKITDTGTGVTRVMADLSEAELRRVWGIMLQRALQCLYGPDSEVKMT